MLGNRPRLTGAGYVTLSSLLINNPFSQGGVVVSKAQGRRKVGRETDESESLRFSSHQVEKLIERTFCRIFGRQSLKSQTLHNNGIDTKKRPTLHSRVFLCQ